ncbi:DEAD/DEAH box helicase [Salinadaptatus halalkaliphilus]|uniref:DEAD/DEAH box helicase n=1 Tax=Salinadaptatus halalkaliphilus TaxID=2419781 RepID=A0A4S3TL27_9EURY|nr:DEAD/DEAH box helicase [Salinadaptatus halalkaliphilus]THE64756.1 DEAD/DEAH box helicase [Salinadaptatus halalkaliphilus]
MTLPNDIPDDDATTVKEIMAAHGYDSLKETQQLAFRDGILDPGNHLLVAETGNGKTLCAEAITKKALENGGRVGYLVPSRQLVRDKRDSLREWGGDEYQIKSDRTAYRSADVAVKTFDSFYQAILRNTGGARNLDVIVLDDFHEIYGTFRGPEIEKSIAAAQYEGIEIFAMSATVGNPEELADWMDADLTVSPEGRQIEIDETVVDVGNNEKKEAVVDTIRKHRNKGPFLVFNYAKPWTESRAEAIADTGLFRGASDRNFRSELQNKIDGRLTDTLETLARSMENGVAFHHADLPTNVTNWIEDLYYDGEIECLCATTTIAYGFDSPVQTVVVADIQRGPNYVGVWEYVQWIGRAARPGYGYEKGYAFTLTDEPGETVGRYFEEHRELERVRTHIENDERFRWLMLELVATGWDTPHEIEAFVKEMLYWDQLKQVGAWGREHESRDERLNRRLRMTADWLIENGFISELDTERGFQTTALGDGAVDFAFNTFASATLSAIKSFYEWTEETEHDDITQIGTLNKTTRLFNHSLSARNGSDELEAKLEEHGIAADKFGITAGVIRWYWMANLDTRDIEERTEVDAAYVSSTARRISQTIDATQYIIDAAPNARRPDWFDTLVARVERGVRHEEVPLVENVRGLGRYRVRMLREYLRSSDLPAAQGLPEGTVWRQLKGFYNEIDDPDQFEEVLRGNINGIGPATAGNVRSFVEHGSVSDRYHESADELEVNSENHSTSHSRATSLDDFGI